MLQTLVVPLDGSSLAERALPFAIQLAQAGQGRLILVRAAMAAPPATLDAANYDREQASAVSEAEAYLRTMAESLAGQVASVETVARYGRASDEILEVTSQFEADGIVMATHGRTGLRHLLYGSVMEAVLARSSVPVFAVYARPGEKAAAPFFPYSARVLTPQDGSDYDAPVLEAALGIVGPQSELVLVTVIPSQEQMRRDEFGNVVAYLDQQEASDRIQAKDYLEGIAARVRDRGTAIPVKVDVRVGDPVSGIEMAAIDNSAHLIVMGTHGRTGIRRAVLGSVAGTVLRTGSTPVLLVHPHAPMAEPTSETREPTLPMVTF